MGVAQTVNAKITSPLVFTLCLCGCNTLSGCAWIKLSTYSARLEYTYRHLIFCTGKKQDRFPWEDVMQMSWVTQRGSVAYLLKIQFRSGLTANLSSNDFVGLTKLKTFYDEGYFK